MVCNSALTGRLSFHPRINISAYILSRKETGRSTVIAHPVQNTPRSNLQNHEGTQTDLERQILERPNLEGHNLEQTYTTTDIT
jgi:hypothetical protein